MLNTSRKPEQALPGRFCLLIALFSLVTVAVMLFSPAYAQTASGSAAAESLTEPIVPVVQNTYPSSVVTSDETSRCLNCHASRQIKLVETWEKARTPATASGCYECHKANPADPAAKNGHFGFSAITGLTFDSRPPVTRRTCLLRFFQSCHGFRNAADR
ncbi:hypothetical protein MASR1M12_44830 [Erysipelotrichia bacterium]